MTAGERYTSDSQRNGIGQEQRFSIPSSPRCALSFCSSLSLHLVNSIVLFSEQWNGLSGSSVLSGVFVLWNKWTDGSKKRRAKKGSRSERHKVCISECICMDVRKSLCVCVCVCVHECVCLDSGGSTECFGILGLGSVGQTGDSGSIFEAEYEGILGGKWREKQRR